MNIYVYNELTQKTQLMLVENIEFEENEIFADDSIRKVWHSGFEEWYLSIFDVVKVLTDSNDPKQYIKKIASSKTTNDLQNFIFINEVRNHMS